MEPNPRLQDTISIIEGTPSVNRPSNSRNSRVVSKGKGGRGRPYPASQRTRFNNPAETTSFLAKSVPLTLSTRVLKYYHPIHTNTSGVSKFAQLVHSTFNARDQRIGKAYSASLLSYVSTIALTYRICRLGTRLGYSILHPEWYKTCEELTRSLVLPEPICKMIECVGKYELATGICLVPYAPRASEYSEETGYTTFSSLLQPEDLVDVDFELPPDPMLLSAGLFTRYIMGSAIAAKFGQLYRKINWDVEDGTDAFTVAYSERNGQLEGYSPQAMDQSTVKIGATYRLREIQSRAQWLGENEDYRVVQTSDTFYEGPFVSSILLEHMIARQ